MRQPAGARPTTTFRIVALLVACGASHACGRTPFTMGSGTYLVDDVVFSDEVEIEGTTHKAGVGQAFVEVEYVAIYDGERLQNCCLDSSAFVTDVTGAKYPLKFTSTLIMGGPKMITKGAPMEDVRYRLIFGPLSADARGLVLHVEGRSISL